MSEQRAHPDLFSAVEACTYLHLATDDNGLRTLQNYREKKWLIGHAVGTRGELMYWREDLDACVLHMVGRANARQPRAEQPVTGPKLRYVGAK